MRDTVSISLLKTANTEKMIEFFKSSNLTKKMIISTNSEDHKDSTKYPNGLYISFGNLTLSQDFFLFSFVKMVANLFGSETTNPQNQSMCKYYRYNAKNFLLVDLKGIKNPIEQIIIYENETFKLINKELKDPRDSGTGILSRFILKCFTEQKELILIYESISQLKHYK